MMSEGKSAVYGGVELELKSAYIQVDKYKALWLEMTEKNYQLQEEIKKDGKQIRTLCEDYNNQKEKNDELQEEINDLRESESVKLGEEDYIKLRKENTELKDKIQAYGDWARQTEDELSGAEEKIDELELKLEYRTRQYQTKSFTLNELYDEIDELEKALEDNEIVIERKSKKTVYNLCDDYLEFDFSGFELWKKNKPVKKPDEMDAMSLALIEMGFKETSTNHFIKETN